MILPNEPNDCDRSARYLWFFFFLSSFSRPPLNLFVAGGEGRRVQYTRTLSPTCLLFPPVDLKVRASPSLLASPLSYHSPSSRGSLTEYEYTSLPLWVLLFLFASLHQRFPNRSHRVCLSQTSLALSHFLSLLSTCLSLFSNVLPFPLSLSLSRSFWRIRI